MKPSSSPAKLLGPGEGPGARAAGRCPRGAPALAPGRRPPTCRMSVSCVESIAPPGNQLTGGGEPNNAVAEKTA